MKTMTKFLVLAVIMFAFGATTFAQTSATANVTATIVTPIAVTKTTDMSFGNVAAGASLGTVVLPPTGARTTTGGVTLPATTGTVTAAQFHITGTAGVAFTLSLPASTTISNGAPNMLVNSIVSDAPATITGGAIDVNVGATLNVAAAQAPGGYTGTFVVNVAYN